MRERVWTEGKFKGGQKKKGSKGVRESRVARKGGSMAGCFGLSDG